MTPNRVRLFCAGLLVLAFLDGRYITNGWAFAIGAVLWLLLFAIGRRE